MPKQKRAFRTNFTAGATPSGVKGGLGQHFLKNPAVISSIVQKAGIKPHDIVLEIGPGSGVLTFKMLPLCKKLIAVELDKRMVLELQKKSTSSHAEKLKIINADVLKTELPFFNLLVANIPYKISSPLVFKLLAHRPLFRAAVIMFQEEFAQRLTAKPGDSLYCRLSVNVQLLADVQQLLKVGRNNFRPPPKVDSRVVRITPKNPIPEIDFLEWDGMVRICFNRKNKTLRSLFMGKKTLKLLEENYRTYCSLKGIDEKMDVDSDKAWFKEKVEKVLEETDMGSKRAAKMGIDDFLELLNGFNKANIRFS
eukprot:augustus_masked-scaffold_5-processed-gene-5.8-mRNA-1 protein AED:0.03 eAED:0.03 QI:0/-1/0/1/-1/1/1/0/308